MLIQEAINKQLELCLKYDGYACGIYCVDEEDRYRFLEMLDNMWQVKKKFQIFDSDFDKITYIPIHINGSVFNLYIADMYNTWHHTYNNGLIISNKISKGYKENVVATVRLHYDESIKPSYDDYRDKIMEVE